MSAPGQDIRSVVWLLMGLTGSAAGLLRLEHGRLSFAAHGRGALTGGQLRKLEQRTGQTGSAERLSAGETVVLFDAPRDAVGNVKFPWYNFGAGMTLRVGEAPYRFSFLQPQNTRLPGDVDALLGAASIPGGRAGGKAWRAALT